MGVLVTCLKRVIDLSMASEPNHQFYELEITLSSCCIEVAKYLTSAVWEEWCRMKYQLTNALYFYTQKYKESY